MSKNKLNIQEFVLSKALEMFNEKGIEYVGLREIAARLNIIVSNITYYFPTKDDLVNQLTVKLSHLNSQTMADNKNLTLHSFLEMLEKVFMNQVQYRCIMLSIVHLMEQNKVISSRHKLTQKQRNKILEENIKTLESGRYLVLKNQDDRNILASTISLIARFWISEAAISYKQLSPGDRIRYPLSLIAHLLLPYTTAKGKRQIDLFMRAEMS